MKKILVEVEVVRTFVEGEAEMKSVNAVAKLSNGMVSRLGILSFMGLMVLTLAWGRTSLAAEDFKLWQTVRVSEKAQALKNLDKAGTEKSVKWLITEPDFKKFSTTFSKEPFQFVEGLKAGMLKSITDSKLADFKTAVKEGFDKLEAKDFGGFVRRNAFMDLLEKILAMDRTKLEDEKFLEDLFSDPAIRNALGLTENDPDARPSPSPSASPSPSVSPNPEPSVSPPPGGGDRTPPPKVDDAAQKARDAEAAKRLADAQAQNAQLQAALQAMQRQSLNTGEVNDGSIERAAQQICDRFNALQNGVAENQNSLAAQLAAANEGFNRLASQSRVPDIGQNQNRNSAEDLLKALAQNAAQQQPQQVAPPPPAPQIPPQQAQNDRNDNNGLFDQPLPPKTQPQPEEQLPPLQFPTQASNAINQPITLDLPSSRGAMELREAEEALSKLEQRTPVSATLSPNANLTELVMAKAKVQSEKRTVQATLANAKDRANRLDEQLEELKEGGRAALPAWVKRKEAELQAKVEKAKKAVEAIQQQAQFAGNDPNARQALTGQFQQLSAQASAAEEEFTKFKGEVEAKVQEGNKQIKSLAKRRDQLQSTASKLEGQLGTLTEEETAMQALISNNMQQQLGAIQAQGQPQTNLTPNVNRIQQGVGRGGAPRSVVPSRIGAGSGANLQSGATVPPAGGQRGNLGAK